MPESACSWTDIISAATSALTLIFSATILFVYRKRENNKIVYEISQRLYEADKTIIEHPEIQVIIRSNVDSNLDMEKSIPDLEKYFQVKSYIYMWLNVIDEMISTVQNEGKQFRTTLGYDRWENYFRILLRHPFFKEICKNEKHIFGVELERWLLDNKPILSQPLTEVEKKIF